jgi:DNA replication and repair protein RecF
VILQSLTLFQFRNIAHLDWEPHPRANLLVGSNAQGKTNLLEALYFLGTSKPLRPGADPQDLIMQGKAEALVRARISQEQLGLTRDLEAQLQLGQPKKFLLNAKKLTPLSKLYGQLPVVLFTPDDLDLVKAGPSARRLYLDMEISQASPPYLADLQRYQRALKQRNGALKMVAEGQAEWDAVEAFDELLVTSGAAIVLYRLQALAELKPLAAEAQARIAGKDERLELDYLCSLKDPRDHASLPLEAGALAHQFRLRLRERAREERGRATTLSGPHRDDLSLMLNGEPAKMFASQGQQRSTALALKLAEVQFLSLKLGEPPVLLLDDVLSELDLQRQTQLLGLLDERVQTFVTSTHADGLAYKPGKTMTVENGVVR